MDGQVKQTERDTLVAALKEYIKPTTLPVGIHLEFDDASLEGKTVRPTERFNSALSVCQGVAAARRYGWTMVFREEDHACPASLVYLNYKKSEPFSSGEICYPGYGATPEAAQKIESANMVLEKPAKEIWIGDLEKIDFAADIALVYGNPAQIARIAQGANYTNGNGVKSTTYARAACATYIVKAFQTDECCLVVPSGGERIFANTQDDELIFAIPKSKFADVAYGIAQVHKYGLSRFPTIFHGVLKSPVFPQKYWDVLKEG